ncbi:hypothetical protein GQ457_11G023740 [Hibiscus cannabinus]
MGGKEVLIKAVLQSIPVYAMQCFLLPSSLCRSLEQIMAKFWWSNGSRRGIHWCTWNRLSQPKYAGGLGFRNLAQFNVALLAKQCWRLISQPKCFLAQVLKARYYPRSDFMCAELGTRPSYIWRSIGSARGLIVKGYGWRVGSGSLINIWNEPWLPGPGDGRVRRDSMDIRHTVVYDLIDPGDRVWKHYVVSELFDEEQTSRICSIPLSKTSCPDEIIWRFDGSGCYTAKSGYRLLMDDQCGNSEGADASLSRFYIALWRANVPSKIKITMWKIANGFLPTLDNLYSRRLVVNNLCPFCQVPGETIAHLLRDCDFANQLVRSLGLPVSSRSVVESWQHWLASYFVRLSDYNRRLLMVTYWSIWFSRNKLVHDGIKTSVQDALSFITAFLREQDAVGIPTRHVGHPGPIHWKAPPLSVIKFNFDAAFNQQSRLSTSEAIACKQAVQFAKELGFSNVVIEGDSLTVLKKIISCALDRSILAPIVFDIKELSLDFHSIIFSFVRRDANNAAHVLARECRSIQTPCYWIEEAPVETTAASEVDRGFL